MIDIINKRFGLLTVVSLDRPNYYLCKCDCGKTNIVLRKSLMSGNTKSCGHLQKDFAKNLGKQNILENSKDRIETDKKYNTNLSLLKNPDIKFKNNTSGYRGISWCKARNKWEAYISVHCKRKRLGRFDDIKEAIEARKNAEKKYFDPIIELAKEKGDIANG